MLALLLTPAIGICSDYNIDTLWKAKAIQSIERLEKLSKKNGSSKGKNLTSKESCEWNLNNAFMAHAKPSLGKMRKEVVNGFTIYKLILQVSGKFYAQVNFSYSKGSTKPAAVNVSMLENNAAITTHDQ